MPAAISDISPHEYKTRTNAVRDWLGRSGYDGLLAVSGYAERDGNVCYLCGHKNVFPYSTKSELVCGLGYSTLLVPRDGKITLVAPLDYQPHAVLGVDQFKTQTNLLRSIVDSINEAKLNSSKIAVAGGDILPAVYVDELRRQFPELTIEYREEVARMRMVKSESELALIRYASKIADEAMTAAIQSIKPGMKESAVGSAAREAAMDAGADYVVRDRVQSGSEIGRLRWPFASAKKIRKGDLVSIDLVGWVNSYGFDILRIGCAGRPTKDQRILVELAGEATAAMSERLRDRGEVESSLSAVKEFEKDGFRIQPFGHGIGLEIVEEPYLLPGVTGKVRSKMVFCVEPTVKSKHGSASIENEVIVTHRKPEILTRLPLLSS